MQRRSGQLDVKQSRYGHRGRDASLAGFSSKLQGANFAQSGPQVDGLGQDHADIGQW